LYFDLVSVTTISTQTVEYVNMPRYFNMQMHFKYEIIKLLAYITYDITST